MEKLKPCPFCGSDFVHVFKCRKMDGTIIKKVRCDNTQCDVMPETIWFNDEQKAITAWNRRVSDV